MEFLTERDKGALPVSIGTSLAIESALGIYPEVEGKDPPYRGDNPPVTQVESIWINVRTLFRNMLGAIQKDDRVNLDPETVAETLSNEMTVIESALTQGSMGRCSTVFYLFTFMGINRRFPYANHRNPNTDGQKSTWMLEEASLKALMELNPAVDFRVHDIEFDENNQVGLIITHYAVDLLNRYKFRKLSLLESHTGAIKNPLQWHTKLHSGGDLVRIPFDRMTLQVFGDSVSFRPAPIKIRRHILEIANKYEWTPATTKAMIMKNIKEERDPILEGFLLKHY